MNDVTWFSETRTRMLKTYKVEKYNGLWVKIGKTQKAFVMRNVGSGTRILAFESQVQKA